MRHKSFYIIGILIFSTAVLSVQGCDESLEFNNTPPGGLSISRDKCYLGPEDQVTLTGSASDADGDSITYRWTAEAGTLIPSDGKGRVVVWRAPDSHGTYRVTLRVTDTIDESSKGIDIDVGRNLDVVHDGGVLDQTDYPYIVPSALPIYIGELFTVTIEAGVTIIFNEGGGGFRVGGTLIINGTQGDRVLMMPNVCPGEERVWKGIAFTGGSASGDISYLTVTSSADGITVEDGASLTADNLIVDQTTGDAVSVKNGASAVISGSQLWDNGGGVYVGNATLQVIDTSIRYNGNYALSLYSTASHPMSVTDCVIANNSQIGIVLAGNASPVVHNCSMFFNGPDIEIRTVRFAGTYTNTNAVDMTGNYWGTDDALEIPPQILREGSYGVVDYSGWLSSPPVIQ